MFIINEMLQHKKEISTIRLYLQIRSTVRHKQASKTYIIVESNVNKLI